LFDENEIGFRRTEGEDPDFILTERCVDARYSFKYYSKKKSYS
jgi:hypothetical protein